MHAKIAPSKLVVGAFDCGACCEGWLHHPSSRRSWALDALKRTVTTVPAFKGAARMRPIVQATRRLCASMSASVKKENVADYPRPPRLEPTTRHLRVVYQGEVVADTNRAWRVCETHHPPTYYLPPEDVNAALVQPSPGGNTMCEWKGRASYFNVKLPSGETVERRIWAYLTPTPSFQPIAGYFSFYASPFECYVDDERVEAQPGDFYGGWKTSDIEGTLKGGPGTWGW